MTYSDLVSVFSQAVTNLDAEVHFGTGSETEFNASGQQSPLVWLFTPTIARDYKALNDTDFREVFNIRLRVVYSGTLNDSSTTATQNLAAAKVIIDQITQQIREAEVFEIDADSLSPLLKIQDGSWTGWEDSFGLVNYQEGDCCYLFDSLVIPPVAETTQPKFNVQNSQDNQILVYNAETGYYHNENPGTYWTQALFDAAFAAKDTDDLDEGVVNFYYTQARFNASLATKTTDDLTEGSVNKYYADALVQTYLTAQGYLTQTAADLLYYKTSDQFVVSESGNIIAYFRGDTAVGYLQIQNSSTGTTANDGFTVGVNSLDAYVLNRENAFLYLGTNGNFYAYCNASGNWVVAGGSGVAANGRMLIRGANNATAFRVEASDGTAYVEYTTSGGGAKRMAFFNGTTVARQAAAAYTSDPESSAYTGIDNAQVGTVYASVADLNALRVAYENLRVEVENNRTAMINYNLR